MKPLASAIAVLLAPAIAGAAPLELPARDKQLHFAASAAITSGTTLYLSASTREPLPAVAFGVGFGLAAGIGKELYDLTGRGTPSGADLAWDVAGVATGAAVSWLLSELLFGRTPLVRGF